MGKMSVFFRREGMFHHETPSREQKILDFDRFKLSMEKYIKKYFWTVNLITIAICSTLAANTMNTFVRASLIGDKEPEIEQRDSDNGLNRESGKNEDLLAKARKNPFTGEDIVFPDEIEQVIEEPEIVEETSWRNPNEFTADTHCKETSIDGELVGTMASTDPTESFAMISMDDAVAVYQVGSQLKEGVDVVAIVRHKVFLRSNGRIECFVHGEQAEQKEEDKEESPSAAPAENDGVRKISETEYILSQDEVDKALSNLNALATQARIVPSFKNGQSNGFRIYSIKPGSLFQKIGIKNGDVIQRINSMDINSPEKALEIYSKLKTEKNLQIDLLRRGSKTTLDYTVQ